MAGALGDALGDLNRLELALERPGMFVTLALLVVDAAGGAEWALAGHPPILHVPAGGGAIARLPNPNLPLGVLADATFATGRCAAAPGDVFVLFTDGLMEVESKARVAFEIEGIERVIAATPDRVPREVAEAIFTEARSHGAQDDDQTLAVVRVL